MSEGSVYERSDGRWCAKYKALDGSWKYLYRKTKPLAKKALREALKDRDDGVIPPSRITVNAMLDLWLEDIQHTVSHRTYLNRQSIITHHLRPPIGTQKLTKLTDDNLTKLYRIKLSQGLAPSTVRRIHTTISQVLKEAVRLKYIHTNPATNAKLPKVNNTRGGTEVLTPAQAKHLLEVVRGDRYELVYVLGVTLGLRIGEALALRWEDVNFSRGTITIKRTLWRGKTYTPKTYSSERILKLPAIALEALHRRDTNGREGWLIPTSKGTPVEPPNFHRWSWIPTKEKAELPPSLTYHKLRHGCASLLLN